MIAFVGGRQGQGWGVYVVGWDGSDLQCLTPTPKPNRALYLTLVWSPDGRKLAFTYKADILQPHAQVCSVEIVRAEMKPLTPIDTSCLIQSWQPDGMITYTESVLSPGKEDRYLCLMGPDGSQAHRWLHFSRYRGVNYEPGSFTLAQLSPYGGRIALIDSKTARLFLLEEGGEPAKVERLELKIHYLAWSPDGRRLAITGEKFQALRQRDLYVMDTESGKDRRLGQIAAESSISWSPDGRKLAGVGYRRGALDYRVIDGASGESVVVASFDWFPNGDDLLQAPQWAHEGEKLAMVQEIEEIPVIKSLDLVTGSESILVGPQAGFTQIMYLSAGPG